MNWTPRTLPSEPTPYALGTKHLAAVLPAYLRGLVEADAFSAVPDAVLLVLARSGPSLTGALNKQRFEELTTALTPQQRSVVAEGLRLFIAEHEETNRGMQAQLVLETYWSQFSQ